MNTTLLFFMKGLKTLGKALWDEYAALNQCQWSRETEALFLTCFTSTSSTSRVSQTYRELLTEAHTYRSNLEKN